MSRLYDCFTFSGEIDLLLVRLNVLNEIVDKFVIVESNYTFSGFPKEYVFPNIQNSADFLPFKDKIIYLQGVPPEIGNFKIFTNAWGREHYARNYFYHALKEMDDDALILLSDLDEIPNPDIIKQAIQENNLPCGFNLVNYFYFFNVILTTSTWHLPTAIPLLFQKKHLVWTKVVDDFALACNNIGFMKMREDRLKYHLYQNSGWHYFSCLGVYDLIDKLQSYAMYSDFKPEIVNFEYLLHCKSNLISYNPALTMKQIPLGSTTAPKYILDNQERFKYLIYQSHA